MVNKRNKFKKKNNKCPTISEQKHNCQNLKDSVKITKINWFNLILSQIQYYIWLNSNIVLSLVNMAKRLIKQVT